MTRNNKNTQTLGRVRITKKHQCPTCGRAFIDRAALLQHEADTHRGMTTGGAMSNLRVNQRFSRKNANIDGTRPLSIYDQRIFTGVNASQSTQQMGSQMIGQSQSSSAYQSQLASMLGDTPDGRAFGFAALDPCGAGEITAVNVGELRGMCDTMTGSVATPGFRSETFLGFSTALFVDYKGDPITNPDLGKSTYGVDMIVAPIPEIVYMYRLIDDSTSLKSPWVVVRQPDYNLPATRAIVTGDKTSYTYNTTDAGVTMASTGLGKTRIIGRGLTIELDAAALNDQGRVVVGQMQGQAIDFELTLPSVATTTGQFVTDVDPTVVKAPAVTGVTNYGSGASTKLQILAVPTSPEVIVANCPSAYQGLAKNGAYIVSKFASPLYGYEFKTTGNQQVYEGANNNAFAGEVSASLPYLPYSALAIVSNGFDEDADLTSADLFWVSKEAVLDARQSGFGNAFTLVNTPTGEENSVKQAQLHPFVSLPSDMMTSVCMFRNLPAGTVNSTTATLRVKARTYIEGISNGSNPIIAPYIHAPAEFDETALRAVVVAGKRLPDAFPACYNSLGGILGSIWNAIKSVGQPLAHEISKLGIPLISDVAGAADTVISGVDQGISAWKRRPWNR